jgi:uncharacterized protein with HEPN domain
MTDRSPKLLVDAIGAIDAAHEFLGQATLSQYADDLKLRSAVERQLEILGEACSRLAKLDASWLTRIPDIHFAIGLRNRIIHGYDSVDDEMLFETIKRDLPMFRVALAEELDKAI